MCPAAPRREGPPHNAVPLLSPGSGLPQFPVATVRHRPACDLFTSIPAVARPTRSVPAIPNSPSSSLHLHPAQARFTRSNETAMRNRTA